MNTKTTLQIQRHGMLTYLLYEELSESPPDDLSDDLPITRMCYSIAIQAADGSQVYAADITDNRDAALRFLNLISECGLSPVHLFDVLEDMLPLY
jgi:hypothetical protein